MNKYEEHMRRCFELAKQAVGHVSPNPLVGCVVLDKNGKKISEGFHSQYGSNHAERDALLKIKNGAEKNGTLIVNLEPCSHHGKTPPCTDLIIERGISKVIMAMRDVNPDVNGVKILKNAGIEVEIGLLENEAKKLNEIFIKNMQEKKAFVAIKTATTLDGKIATSTGSSKWITSEKAREEVKFIRNKYDAILTSSSTIIADNPTMNHTKKIILDTNLKTDISMKIFTGGEIFIFNSIKDSIEGNINYIKTPVKNDGLDIDFVIKQTFELGIRSVLVEAGSKLNGAILPYADKIYHFIAPKITNDNSSKSCFNNEKIYDINKIRNFRFDSIKTFEPDILLIYYPK